MLVLRAGRRQPALALDHVMVLQTSCVLLFVFVSWITGRYQPKKSRPSGALSDARSERGKKGAVRMAREICCVLVSYAGSIG